MSNRTIARLLAAAGWSLSLAASGVAIAVMYFGAGVTSPLYASRGLAGPYSALVLWCAVPVGLATIACAAIMAGAMRLAFLPIGTLGLFIVGAAFSFGFVFVPANGLLLTAALVQWSEQKDRWTLAISWLWLLVGATALLPLLALLTTLHGSPLPSSGSGMTPFGITAIALLVCESAHLYRVRERN